MVCSFRCFFAICFKTPCSVYRFHVLKRWISNNAPYPACLIRQIPIKMQQRHDVIPVRIVGACRSTANRRREDTKWDHASASKSPTRSHTSAARRISDALDHCLRSLRVSGVRMVTPAPAAIVVCPTPSCPRSMRVLAGNATALFGGTVNVLASALSMVTILKASERTKVYAVPVCTLTSVPSLPIALIIGLAGSLSSILIPSPATIDSTPPPPPPVALTTGLAGSLPSTAIPLPATIDSIPGLSETSLFRSAVVKSSSDSPLPTTLSTLDAAIASKEDWSALALRAADSPSTVLIPWVPVWLALFSR